MAISADEIGRALDALAVRDPDLARGLDLVGYPPPRNREPGFATLLNIIVGQQVSAEAAAAIRGRLALAADPLTPSSFLALDDAALRAVGLSRRKMEYGRLLAEAVLSNAFDPLALHALPDEAVREQIVALKGLGRWSADIYLLFALGRADCFPAGDLAIQVALQKLKRLEARPTPAGAEAAVEGWRPWRGVGALFLWHYYRGAP